MLESVLKFVPLFILSGGVAFMLGATGQRLGTSMDPDSGG
jgi:hypothetical protein